jgi:hypothetical protein
MTRARAPLYQNLVKAIMHYCTIHRNYYKFDVFVSLESQSGSKRERPGVLSKNDKNTTQSNSLRSRSYNLKENVDRISPHLVPAL